MSEATQLTQISDNVNQGYIAGRDLYLGDQYAVQETLYFEPDLRDVDPSTWTTTPMAYQLAETLFSQRLIVLAGQDLENKTMVARNLAWLLREKLQPDEVSVREWYRSSDPQKIETAFHPTATTILLLPQVLPHHVGHRLNELRRVLLTRRNYLIITTDGIRADWQILSGSPEESLWCDLSWETYYGRTFLSTLLRQELEGKSYPSLTDALLVEEIAAHLKQPEKIQEFAQWLSLHEVGMSREAIQAQVHRLSGDVQAISLWYQQLERDEQLLALGLVLFDGLPDDQVFAILELLVIRAWRETDPRLPLFDYHNLQRLGAYFHLTDIGEDGARIETSSRQKSDAILLAAWKFQRRRLLATLPAVTKIIKGLAVQESLPADAPADGQSENQPNGLSGAVDQLRQALKGKSSHWRFTQGPERELYSSPKRVHHLQQAVIESLSRIGLLSFEAVEASFLELAVEGSSGFQTIVAKSLASWRGSGHSEQLFRVLRGWWKDGCNTSSVDLLAQRTARKGTDPFVAMRSTVALTAGYAMQYDPPNCLSPELISLIQALAQDRSLQVRRHVLQTILPIGISSHLLQLEEVIRSKFLLAEDHMYAVAVGVSMAYTQHPVEALEVINRWRNIASCQEAQAAPLVPREKLLAAVCLAYGYTRCHEGDEALTPNQIINTLRQILATEKHPYIRRHALFAMGLQAVHSFELGLPMMLELVSDTTLADRHHVITVFAHAYLHQRRMLTGGDAVIEIDGRTFAVWKESKRPLTSIEEALYSWLKNTSHPVAQQIATQTLAILATTELEKRERLPYQRPPENWQQRSQISEPSPMTEVPNLERVHKLFPLGQLALLSAMPREQELRAQMWPIMAQILEMQQQLGIGQTYQRIAASLQSSTDKSPSTVPNDAFFAVLLQRWMTAGGEDVTVITRKLQRALVIYRYRWLFIALMLVSYMFACGAVSVIKTALFESSPPAAVR